MKRTATLIICSLFSLSVFSQNKSLHFDGINDYVHIPENTGVLTGNTFTFEAWVRPTNLSYYQWVVNKGTSNNAFCIYFANDEEMTVTPQLNFFVYNGSSVYEYIHNISLAWLNQWHHVAVSCNGSSISMYVDGVFAGSSGWSGSIPLNSGYLRLGSSNDGYGNFAGNIDEVRIWNVGRTQAQIQSFMNSEISPGTAGLKAYYKLNQGTIDGNNTAITSVTDQLAVPTHGALNNFAKTGSTSNFTSGYASLSTLPLKDASFTAIKKDGAVQLNWKSLPSQFNTTFEIERSTDAVQFSKIGSITINPSPIELDHMFTDQEPNGTIIHYRIKAIDGNGQITYSKIIAVRLDKNTLAFQTYPNPVQNTLGLQINAPRGTVMIQVKDLSGRTIQSLQLRSMGTTLYTSLDVSQLPAGTYVVLANNESSQFIKR
jgi:hypothetical protein